MKVKVLLCLGLLYLLAVNCSESPEINYEYETITWNPNPNGDSELALLMRKMFDDAYLMKQQIELGHPVTVKMDHKNIVTAHATEPEKAASPEYKAFAQTYLNAMESLNSATKENVEVLYENIVTNCRSCHQAMCPGPLARIKYLDFPDE